tara:strand:- start:95 stop:805 length:711 start_codon:yes stop_codon:yes gene_type:complete
MKTSKHVFIDIDDTLYSYANSNKKALHSVFSYISDESDMNIDEIRTLYELSRNHIKLNLSNTSSSHNKLLHFRKLTEALNIEVSANFLSKLNNLYWHAFYENLTPLEGLESLFEYFSKNNFKIIFFTDYNLYFQLNKLEKLNLGSLNSIIYSSEEVGFDKPSDNFKKYLKNYVENNVSPNDEVFVIGNDKKKDIDLIKSIVKCKSFLIGSKIENEYLSDNEDYIVTNLKEILKHLK